jgi:hypothetical protein
VIDRVVGVVAHYLVDVLAFEGFSKVVDDFFSFVGHDTGFLLVEFLLPFHFRGRVWGLGQTLFLLYS